MKKARPLKSSHLIDNHRELSVIKHCLNYCWHRCIKHECNLLERLDLKDLDKLRKEFN